MHTERTIIVTKEDRERLEGLFATDVNDSNEQPNLRALREELDSATVVDPEEVPPDVVTLDSTVRLCDSRSSYEDTYKLVNPQEDDITDGQLSVLAPIGSAILGYRVGDDVRWPVPGGSARFRIKEVVFQPERDGFFVLPRNTSTN
ncbi:MAG: nucleoside diphosphate kinase regulator [Planctomycetaceae bacterium]